MVTRADIVAEALSWSGTPTKHQGRRKGVSVDCLGLALGVGNGLDLPEATALAISVANYPKGFAGRRLLDGLSQTLIRVAEAQPGDILAIMFGRDCNPRHLAILTRPGWIVHAYFGHKFVAEVPLSHLRVHSCWTWPSLGETIG